MFFANQVALLMRILVVFFRKMQKSEKNRLFFQWKKIASYKTVMKFWLYWESSMKMQSAIAIGGRAAMMLLHALCVSVYPSLWLLNENPIWSATSVREKHWFYSIGPKQY